MDHIDKIVLAAKSYLGQEEITPNLGFKDYSFNAKMNAVGFYKGASWCGFFVMLVMHEVYSDDPEAWAYLHKYLSASTHTMWLNFKASKEIVTGQVPKIGAVVIWQEGNGTSGHTGIVTAVDADGKHFVSVEGNTDGNGGRNGYRVWNNLHLIGQPHSEKGLNLLGFGYMPE